MNAWASRQRELYEAGTADYPKLLRLGRSLLESPPHACAASPSSLRKSPGSALLSGEILLTGASRLGDEKSVKFVIEADPIVPHLVAKAIL